MRLVLATLALLACVPACLAHDFWIAPSETRAQPNQTVRLQILVGHAGDITAFERRASHIRRFLVAGPDGDLEPAGTEGGDPAGLFAPQRSGYHVVGYRSNPSLSTLDADRFDAYLAEEGLDNVRALREERGDEDEPGRERYARCAKAIVAVGDDLDDGYDRELGLTLELVPAANPAEHAASEPFPVRLVYEGRSLAGVLVEASPTNDLEATLTGRTDAEGRVSFDLDRAGTWRFTAVHMVDVADVPAADAEPAADADWQSYWASLVLDVRG